MKSFVVVPLTCNMLPTLTVAPVDVKLATIAVTFVAYGTVIEMVLAFSSMIPVVAGLLIEGNYPLRGTEIIALRALI